MAMASNREIKIFATLLDIEQRLRFVFRFVIFFSAVPIKEEMEAEKGTYVFVPIGIFY